MLLCFAHRSSVFLNILTIGKKACGEQTDPYSWAAGINEVRRRKEKEQKKKLNIGKISTEKKKFTRLEVLPLYLHLLISYFQQNLTFLTKEIKIKKLFKFELKTDFYKLMKNNYIFNCIMQNSHLFTSIWVFIASENKPKAQKIIQMFFFLQ